MGFYPPRPSFYGFHTKKNMFFVIPYCLVYVHSRCMYVLCPCFFYISFNFLETPSGFEQLHLFKQLWRAPELLRGAGPLRGTQKGDLYAFGIILFEIYGRSGPYGEEEITISEIIEQVTNPPQGGPLTRPNIELLRKIKYFVLTLPWLLFNFRLFFISQNYILSFSKYL